MASPSTPRRSRSANLEGDRLGVGQDPAEALRQHQRRHDGPGHRPGGQRRRPGRPRGSSCCRSIRATCAPAVQSGEASLGAARSQLEQLRLGARSARTRAEAGRGQLPPPAGTLEGRPDDARDARAGGERPDDAQGRPRSQEQNLETQQLRIRAGAGDARERPVRPEQGPHRVADQRHRHAPQHRRGETAVIGTMNNAGTVLLTIADMSVIEAEVEVDETDIPNVQLGQIAKVTIDAIPGKTFTAKVTEIGNSPIQTTGQAATPGDQLQGDAAARRGDSRRPARLHLHRRDHDRHARQRRRRPDPGDDGPRDGGRRQGTDRARTGDARAAAVVRHACRPRS